VELVCVLWVSVGECGRGIFPCLQFQRNARVYESATQSRERVTYPSFPCHENVNWFETLCSFLRVGRPSAAPFLCLLRGDSFESKESDELVDQSQKSFAFLRLVHSCDDFRFKTAH
jgi:hypothetical protein